MATDVEEQFIVVSHSNREEYANTLKSMIEETLHPKKVFITDSYMGSGANIGPGMIGVYFLGDKVSEDMTFEKETINAILGK
jgi:fatty acid-binding protein DegV